MFNKLRSRILFFGIQDAINFIEKKVVLSLLVSFICGTVIIANSSVAPKEKQSIDERIDKLLSQMTIDEKVAQMRIYSANLVIEISEKDSLKIPDLIKKEAKFGVGGIKNPGIQYSPERAAVLNNKLQEFVIKNSRLGIPALLVTESYSGVDATGCTKFGRPIALSSTWNTALIKKVYDVIGREARLRNLNMTHSPVADLARDPRFGRMSETFGEDTYLTTEMIVNAITGMQGDSKGLSSTHIGAVTKHFAGYAQVTGGRNFASIEISPRTLTDEVLPPFKAAVQRANTLGMMASHGDINGVASHANPDLLTRILRQDWGYKGYVVSDAFDIARLHSFMKVANSYEDAVDMALKAGVDVDLFSDQAYVLLPEMVKTHPELIKYIDESVRRVLRTKFTLGLFENPYTNVSKAKNETRNQMAIELANEADLESIILLKNMNNILPLSNNEKKKIALVGPLVTSNTKADFEGVAGANINFVSESGYVLTNNNRGNTLLTSFVDVEKGISKIVETAKNADAVILFVGDDEYTAHEALFVNVLGDRDDLDLANFQDLIFQRLKALGKPVIVALKHRRTLSINEISDKADAILDCWELSEFGDKSIAKLVFGQAVPSGKLPVTVPRSVGQLPCYYSQKEINYKKGYLFTPSTPLYSFGYGLSYTTFKYSNLRLSDSIMNKSNEIKVSIDVQNTGKCTGKEVVQFYIKDLIGSVVRPIKELKYFDKIELKSGEQKTVTFTIQPDVLKYTGLNMKESVEEGRFQVLVGGSSEAQLIGNFRFVEK